MQIQKLCSTGVTEWFLSFQKSFYLGVYYEDLAHRNPNLEVAKLICISIPKSSIERMRVGRKQCFDSLLGTVDQYIIIFSKSTKIIQDFFFLLEFVRVPRSTSYSPLGMRSWIHEELFW
jgi:hypothetical protein